METEGEEIYYDASGNRLVFLASSATPEYWDGFWRQRRNPNLYRRASKYGFTARYTRKYLPPRATVLEGGCGLAQQSWNLAKLGYRTIALDFAETTIEYLKERVPEVNPVHGDVRRLPLPDGSVDGYWSFGVIEHFYGGYQEIRDEMARVIRPGGYLFLTFPHMNRLRRARAAMNRYPKWDLTHDRLGRFYQFALDESRVAADFASHGFLLKETKGAQGLTGLRRDLPITASAISALESNTRRLGAVAAAAAERAARLLASHIAFLVLQRRDGSRADGRAP